ncbi:MAG: DNA-processing protein DprA [Planctomycetota bacterium]
MAVSSAPDGDRICLLALTMVDGLGPVRLRGLLDRFGTPRDVLNASIRDLETVDGIGPSLAASIAKLSLDAAREELLRMGEKGVKLLCHFDQEYPVPLRETPVPPLTLTMKGSLMARDRAAIAIVGSRRCSAYGRKMAERLSRDLASRGITVVSGLARGIDGVAHSAAMAAGGRTLAVLASGLANIYPPEHARLAEEVSASGALFSEAPLDGPPIGGLFPQRNRIISGLSLGVVVIEAAARSGALSTAHHALEQNREVFAVPGRVGDAASEGTNALIKKGACLVRGVEDILEQLGPLELPNQGVIDALNPVSAPPNLTPTQQQLWDALGNDDIELESLLEQTGLRASEANSALLLMEMRKLVRRLPGNRYMRVS